MVRDDIDGKVIDYLMSECQTKVYVIYNLKLFIELDHNLSKWYAYKIYIHSVLFIFIGELHLSG